jgi:hypothetical protein
VLQTETKSWVTEDVVAKMFGKSRRTIEFWRVKGIGPPFVKIGRTVCYRLEAIDEWMRGREFASIAEARAALSPPSTDLQT